MPDKLTLGMHWNRAMDELRWDARTRALDVRMLEHVAPVAEEAWSTGVKRGRPVGVRPRALDEACHVEWLGGVRG